MRINKAVVFLAFIFGVFVGSIGRPYLPPALTIPLPRPAVSPTQFPIPTESIASPEANVQGVTTETAKVVEVVDGDTIKLDNGETVRYVGIDTPETKHPNKGVQCFGKKASEKNTEIVLGKTVRMDKDVSERDRYGRLLRFIYLPTGQGELFVNDYLVREGYARAITYPPDVRERDRFKDAELQAKTNNKGLWNECQ